MSHKIKVMLDNDVWQDMRVLSCGERSLLVNCAIRVYFLQQRRQKTVEEMDVLRRSTRALPGSTSQWVKEDRENHN